MVAKRMPKASEAAIGFRNWACTSFSNKRGARPKKVVREVRRMARKRFAS